MRICSASAGGAGGGNAPPTTMPLILAGVIAEKDPAKGLAIIGDTAAAGKLYSVGAAIPGGARSACRVRRSGAASSATAASRH